MGLFGALFGKKPKHAKQEIKEPPRPNIGITVEVQGSTPCMDTHKVVETEDITNVTAPEKCGFSFENVRLKTERIIDTETGELQRDDAWIEPEGHNLLKIESDIEQLYPFLAQFEKPYNYPIKTFAETVSALSAFSAPQSITSANPKTLYGEVVILRAKLFIEPLTATGRIKKHPVKIDLIFDVPLESRRGKMHVPLGQTQNSIIAHLWYLKDGTIGKGDLILWKRRVGYRCKFAKADDGYVLKELSAIDAGHNSTGQWAVLAKQ